MKTTQGNKLIVPSLNSFEAAIDFWRLALNIYNTLIDEPHAYSFDELREWWDHLQNKHAIFCEKRGLKKNWSRMKIITMSFNQLLPELNLQAPESF